MSSTSPEHICRHFSVDEIVSATNNFDDSLVIGKGGFGTVYRGILDNGASTVAMKRLSHSSKQGAPEFWAEINMLSRFRHSHLVSLIGYCNDNNEMVLVYDYMIHGTLADHLYKNRKNDIKSVPLSWVQRLKICIGAARGLDYLHTGTFILERVIHRDVKSSNILLDGNWAAKISDFGLSRIGPADQECTDVTTKHIQGTFGYMDPDYFLTRKFTRKTDVYAFGVVLLEVLSERPALDRSILDEDQWGLAGWGQQCINDGAPHRLIGPNLKWEILQTSLVEFVEIAGQCLHSRPKKRPTMSEVVAKLEHALALQLRTELIVDDDYPHADWPFAIQENAESYSEDNQIVQIADLGSIQISQFENTLLLGGQNVIPNLKIYTFEELKTATQNFTLRVMGGGGRVYKGWVDKMTCCPSAFGTGKAIAVKWLLPGALDEGMAEVEILGKSNHPNLVKLLGYYIGAEDSEFILVYEFMPNGSLNHHLYGRAAKPLPWKTRIKIAIGAAQALSFFTENQVILRDFKTSNILLDADFNARLSNFRMAKRGSESGKTESSTLGFTSFYAAPEYIATGSACTKSDIYGVGVVLLEILTGMSVIDYSRRSGETYLENWVKPLLVDKKLLRKVIDPSLGNHYPRQGALELATLIAHCLRTDPELRPSIKQVLYSLDQINSILWFPKWNWYAGKLMSSLRKATRIVEKTAIFFGKEQKQTIHNCL